MPALDGEIDAAQCLGVPEALHESLGEDGRHAADTTETVPPTSGRFRSRRRTFGRQRSEDLRAPGQLVVEVRREHAARPVGTPAGDALDERERIAGARCGGGIAGPEVQPVVDAHVQHQREVVNSMVGRSAQPDRDRSATGRRAAHPAGPRRRTCSTVALRRSSCDHGAREAERLEDVALVQPRVPVGVREQEVRGHVAERRLAERVPLLVGDRLDERDERVRGPGASCSRTAPGGWSRSGATRASVPLDGSKPRMNVVGSSPRCAAPIVVIQNWSTTIRWPMTPRASHARQRVVAFHCASSSAGECVDQSAPVADPGLDRRSELGVEHRR